MSVVAQGYPAQSVQVICQDAQRQAGAVTNCTITRFGVGSVVRVTYVDDQGRWTAETLQ